MQLERAILNGRDSVEIRLLSVTRVDTNALHELDLSDVCVGSFSEEKKMSWSLPFHNLILERGS